MVESAPPEGIRPGQAGLLVDEVVNPVAVTATLVDLAVRGYLRIEELPDRAESMEPDWRLVRLKAADEDLLGYERVLLDGLFASRRRAEDLEVVRLSDLVAVTVVGAALTALAVWLTRFGLVAIPILLAGPVLLVGARRMPSRTPVGAGLLRRVTGFRTYLETAGVDRAGPAQAADQFSPYLPYAIVFGLTEQWTRTFALVGAPPQTPWYGGRGPYAPDRFPAHIHRFASSSAATLTAPPAAVSGSSGFGGGGSSGGGGGGSSGGGGGGGGGGSW